MQALKSLTSRCVPVIRNDVDTDQIIPARFLKTTTKKGLGAGLFCDWKQEPSFELNHYTAEGRQILLSGENFGCGSSREHAPWSLIDWGFRVIIAKSFADIFQNNALKNGLLPVALSEEIHRSLVAQVEANSDVQISIDVENKTVLLPNGEQSSFELDDFSRGCLLQGHDQLGYLLSKAESITSYEATAPIGTKPV